MSGQRKLLYYKLTPIFESPVGTLQSAAVQQCLATGALLARGGGGGKALAPAVVEALDMRNNDGQPMVVCKAALFDSLVETLRGVMGELPQPDSVTANTIDAIANVLAWVEREEDAAG